MIFMSVYPFSSRIDCGTGKADPRRLPLFPCSALVLLPRKAWGGGGGGFAINAAGLGFDGGAGCDVFHDVVRTVLRHKLLANAVTFAAKRSEKTSREGDEP
jgi:hypothetical protein